MEISQIHSIFQIAIQTFQITFIHLAIYIV